MQRLCCLLCALWIGAGCASDGDKAQWAEAMKDLRGDNMKMTTDTSKFKAKWDD